MISKKINIFCSEDPSLIENYDKAINDQKHVWECHHRLETELNVNVQYLIDNNLYFNRPASELIFLTKSEHSKLHSTGKRNSMYGKNSEDYMSQRAIIEKREKQSNALKSEKNGRYHTKQMYKNGIYKTVKLEDIDIYLNDGWIIKGKPHNKKKRITPKHYPV